ncbi:MAG: acyl-CoA dehydrogenase family protein [Polyangiales bacterium]
MDFSFTEAQDAVTQVARKLFTERLTPQVLKAIDARDERYSSELWTELATSGLLGTCIAEDHGGSAHGFLELCSLLVEAGAAVAPVPLWPTLALGALPIAQLGSDSLRARLLPDIVSGKIIVTAALSETGSGEPHEISTRALRDAGGWILSGAKTCVPAGMLADRMLVTARAETGEVGLFLVDASANGVAQERQLTTNRESLARVTLTDVRVDDAEVLVAPSAKGAEALEMLLQHATVALCAIELGVVERALRMTASYTTSRQQFDRPIATFQAVTQRAGDAYVDVEVVRLTMWRAAWLLSEGRDAREAIAIAKYFACDAGHRVVYAAQHLHGGMGFDLDYPLHRYYLWSKQIELTLGSAAMHLTELGASLAARL